MILNLFFPRRCVSCNKIGNYFCPSCRQKIKFIDFLFCPLCRHPSLNGATHPRCRTLYSLDGLYVGAHYTGSVKKAIHLMKYRYVTDLVKELTSLLLPYPPVFLKTLDLFIPVPLHRKREKARGFNQSFLIAKKISEMVNLPVQKDLLKRIKATKPQFGLKVSQRKLNVRDVFQVVNPEMIKNKRIGLVDDVATTFSTLKECTKVLKKARAQSVWAIVLAHGN